MNQNPAPPKTDEATDPMSVYAKTDLTALVEVIQTIAQENKKGMDELTKLHRNMYNSIIQKQNDELENYRRGALRQSKVDVLRSVAEIYNENNQDFEAVDNPAALLSYVISQLKELLQDNDVQIVQSVPGTAFERKTMRTQERHTVPTSDSAKDRTVIESLKPGYVFFGEPLLQEFVSIYKYVPTPIVPIEEAPTSKEDSNLISADGDEQPSEIAVQEDSAEIRETTSPEINPEESEGSIANNLPVEEKLSKESEDMTHA